ncbi:MAG: hypothetical protein ORN54_10510, partial [Cyclobacteriaceae bacterium]|nr:hypothetical protein [Cyclobacteriaceae bacterium]
FEEAFQTLQRVDIYSENDSIAIRILYESALNAYLARKPDVCLSKLAELQTYKKPGDQFLIGMLEILALNELRKWDTAHIKFLKLKNEFARHLEDPYENRREYKMKAPDKASNLSYVLPGVGQWYAGYFGKGVVSAFINGGLITFSVLSMVQGYYFSGAFTGVLLFYNGGIRYAGVLASQRNDEKAKKFNDRVKYLLVEIGGKNVGKN